MAKHAMNTKGLLPLGFIVSLSLTLTGFEYMSAETVKTKKLKAHIMPESSGVDFIPEIPKPEMPKPEVQEEKPSSSQIPTPVVDPIGPIIGSPNPPVDPFEGSLEPVVGKLPSKFGDQEVVIEVIEEGVFLAEFPTYEEFLSIKNSDERRMKTDITLKNKVQAEASYPELARHLNIEGTVYVTFVVDKDGTITDVELLRGVHESLDQEAIKAVKKLPKMVPGKKLSKPVKVRYKVPVKFDLK